MKTYRFLLSDGTQGIVRAINSLAAQSSIMDALEYHFEGLEHMETPIIRELQEPDPEEIVVWFFEPGSSYVFEY